MSNIYLEKIALNKFEQYLADQPADKRFSDPRIIKAKISVQKSEQLRRIGTKMLELGAPEGSAAKYHKESRDVLRNHRGNRGVWDKKTDPTFTFKMPNPEPKRIKAKGRPSFINLNKAEKLINNPSVKVTTNPSVKVTTNPSVKVTTKSRKALMGLALIGGAGLIGYGIKKNITD
jgi:hypothetical protein